MSMFIAFSTGNYVLATQAPFSLGFIDDDHIVLQKSSASCVEKRAKLAYMWSRIMAGTELVGVT